MQMHVDNGGQSVVWERQHSTSSDRGSDHGNPLVEAFFCFVFVDIRHVCENRAGILAGNELVFFYVFWRVATIKGPKT